MPSIDGDAELVVPEIRGFRFLGSDEASNIQPSRLYYFLTGDATDPSARCAFALPELGSRPHAASACALDNSRRARLRSRPMNVKVHAVRAM